MRNTREPKPRTMRSHKPGLRLGRTRRLPVRAIAPFVLLVVLAGMLRGSPPKRQPFDPRAA
jgi:hypothetical protein